MKLKFDKKTFNSGYAYVYTLLQRIFLLGFIAGVCVVILGATTHVTCYWTPLVVDLYIFVSLVGFPIVSIMKLGYKRLVVRSTVTYTGETLIFNKLAKFEWTSDGHVEEHHIYTVSKIDSITETIFSYVIKGAIKKDVINNGRKSKSKRVDTVKIPKAYADMDTLFNA